MQITIIDSGLGGTLFKEFFNKNFPQIDIVLKIDKEGFPYGDKRLEWLKDRLIELVDKTTTNNVLIACNTLSSIIYKYNLKFKKTVVDVIRPTTYFFLLKKYKSVCILATKNTIKMQIYDNFLDCEIYYIDSSILISDLENKNNYEKSLNDIVSMIPSPCDSILLGCTHLIAVKDELRTRVIVDVISQEEIISHFFKMKTIFNE